MKGLKEEKLFNDFDDPKTYIVDLEKNLSGREILVEAAKIARPNVSGDTIRIVGCDQKLALEIYLSSYGMGHRCESKFKDEAGNWFVILKLADVAGPYPNLSVFRNLKLKKNRKNCQVNFLLESEESFRFYSILPEHVQFCAETGIYYDGETQRYYREPESNLNRRQSLRSHWQEGYSYKKYIRYQRRYCPWNIKDNDYMYYNH